MRLAGAALLTAAGMLAGLLQEERLRDRAERRESLCRVLDMMEFELERFRTPLPALFEKLSEQMDGDAGAFCEKVAEGLRKRQERDMAGIWRSALQTLPASERKLLASLGGVLGRYGAEEQ